MEPPKNVNIHQFYPDVDFTTDKGTVGEVVTLKNLPPKKVESETGDLAVVPADGATSPTDGETTDYGGGYTTDTTDHHGRQSVTWKDEEQQAPSDGESDQATASTAPPSEGVPPHDNTVPPTSNGAPDEVFSTQVDEDTIEAAKARSGGGSNTIFDPEKWSPDKQITSMQQVIDNKAHKHYMQAMRHLEAEEHHKCITALTKAINLRPKEIPYYIHRGEAYLQLCDFQSAILNYKKACVLDPDNYDFYSRLAFVYYFYGQCLFDQKLFPEALEAFSRAAEMRPEVVGYHTRSIACLAALHRHGECLALVNKRLETEQENADLYVMRARLHQLFRNTTLSYYDVKDALTLDPNHAEAIRLMQDLETKAHDLRKQAAQLNLLGRHRDALQKVSVAIETNPSIADYHVLRGALHRRLGDFNAAIDDYLLALDKTDHNEEHPVYKESQRQLLLTYNDFAVECFTKGFYEEAIILLNKAIKGEKNEKGLYINRGDCFFKEGNIQFALADYHQAMEIDASDEIVRSRIAALHFEHGVRDYLEKNNQEAESRFTLSIQHSPRVGRYYLARCKARQQMDNLTLARQDIMMSLLLDPTNDETIGILSRMFPGKSIKEVLQSKYAHQARQQLENLVVTASPVKLNPVKSEDGDNVSTTQSTTDLASASVPSFNVIITKSSSTGGMPTLKQCMEETQFNKEIADEKRYLNGKIKVALKQRKTLRHEAARLGPLPPPKKKGGSAEVPIRDVTGSGKKLTGWRNFGLGIS